MIGSAAYHDEKAREADAFADAQAEGSEMHGVLRGWAEYHRKAAALDRRYQDYLARVGRVRAAHDGRLTRMAVDEVLARHRVN